MEYITQKFILNKSNKLNIRLDNPLELSGNEWYCGLKEFSLEPKWSLSEDQITVNFKDGTSRFIKPINTFAASNIDVVLQEIFPAKRVKRAGRKSLNKMIGIRDRTVNEEESDGKEKAAEPSKPVITAVGGSVKPAEQEKNTTPPAQQETTVAPTTVVATTPAQQDTKAAREEVKTQVNFFEDSHYPQDKKRKIEKVQTKSWSAPEEFKTKVNFSEDVHYPQDRKRKIEEIQTKSWNTPEEFKTKVNFVEDIHYPQDKKRKIEEIQTKSWNAPEEFKTKINFAEDSHYIQSPTKKYKVDNEAGAEGLYLPEKSKPEAQIGIFDDTDTESEEGEAAKDDKNLPSIISDNNQKVGERENNKDNYPSITSDNSEKVGEHQPVTSDNNLPSITSDNSEKVGEHEPVTSDNNLPSILSDIKAVEKEGEKVDQSKHEEVPRKTPLTVETTTETPLAVNTADIVETSAAENNPSETDTLEDENKTKDIDIEMTDLPTKQQHDPQKISEFQLSGLNSITFKKTSENRYNVSYDSNYIKSIKLSHGFAQATGFTQTTTLLNNDISTDAPAIQPLYSHLCLYMHGLLRPLNKNHEAEIAVIPIQKEKTVYSFFTEPLYLKVEKTFVDSISLEFKDFLENPIVCDNANGHFILQFVKKR